MGSLLILNTSSDATGSDLSIFTGFFTVFTMPSGIEYIYGSLTVQLFLSTFWVMGQILTSQLREKIESEQPMVSA